MLPKIICFAVLVSCPVLGYGPGDELSPEYRGEGSDDGFGSYHQDNHEDIDPARVKRLEAKPTIKTLSPLEILQVKGAIQHILSGHNQDNPFTPLPPIPASNEKRRPETRAIHKPRSAPSQENYRFDAVTKFTEDTDVTDATKTKGITDEVLSTDNTIKTSTKFTEYPDLSDTTKIKEITEELLSTDSTLKISTFATDEDYNTAPSNDFIHGTINSLSSLPVIPGTYEIKSDISATTEEMSTDKDVTKTTEIIIYETETNTGLTGATINVLTSNSLPQIGRTDNSDIKSEINNILGRQNEEEEEIATQPTVAEDKEITPASDNVDTSHEEGQPGDSGEKSDLITKEGTEAAKKDEGEDHDVKEEENPTSETKIPEETSKKEGEDSDDDEEKPTSEQKKPEDTTKKDEGEDSDDDEEKPTSEPKKPEDTTKKDEGEDSDDDEEKPTTKSKKRRKTTRKEDSDSDEEDEPTTQSKKRKKTTKEGSGKRKTTTKRRTSPRGTRRTRTRTTTKRTTTTTRFKLDVPALLAIIANLTYDYEVNLTAKLNKTLMKYSVPTCETPTTTVKRGMFLDYDANATGTIVAKCFVCGLENYGIPRDAYCGDAFAGDFLPLMPVDMTARGRISKFRKYCRYADVPGIFKNMSQPRSVFGRWTGGCSVRWIDLSNVYTQRSCRSRERAIMGKNFASKRMAKLEMALKHTDNGCITSPMATLVPLSRGISLYARFHACVCTGSWCNAADARTPWPGAVLLMLLFACISPHLICNSFRMIKVEQLF